MNLDEALAVYAYLAHRAPSDRSEAETRAFAKAWGIICEYAQRSIHAHLK